MDIIKSFIFILLLVTLHTANGIAQNEPKELAEQFFSDFITDGTSVALDKLYSTNPWMAKSADAVVNLKNQMEGLTEDFIGKYHGNDLIVEKGVSDSFLLLSYLVKFDRQPLRFTFQFYKPVDRWRIHSFQYDGNITNEVEESAKLHYKLTSE